MQEPNPNRFKNVQNYISALRAHWAQHGGPSNQNRAISIRLQMWFERERARKKNLANNIKTLRREFNEYGIARSNNSNASSSDSNTSYIHPSSAGVKKIQKTLRQLKRKSEQHMNSSNKLDELLNAVYPHKSKLSYQRYAHVRNVKIPRTKARIRAQHSTRTFEQLRNKLGNKLPLNIVQKIFSLSNIPSGLITPIGKKVRNDSNNKTNFNIYKTENGRHWFQNQHGRWYLMSSPTQRWRYSSGERKWKPS
jgi:hypothetical protein